MAACRIVNSEVTRAITEIGTAKSGYDTAANTFVTAFHAAIADMEGEAKDALLLFFDNEVRPFIETDMPGAVDGMQKLLQANLDNFIDVDLQIAKCISGN